MAFDAVASGVGRREDGDNLITILSQKIWTLNQAFTIVEKLVLQIGTSTDSITLRQRLSTAESKVATLWSDIDSGSRKLRVASANGSQSSLGAMERFQTLYNDARKRMQEVLLASKNKQANSPAPSGADPANSFDSYKGGSVPNRGASVYTQPHESLELSAIRPMQDVDEAILDVC
jgi:hypothetical protein